MSVTTEPAAAPLTAPTGAPRRPSFARVTWIVFWRQLRIALRNPACSRAHTVAH